MTAIFHSPYAACIGSAIKEADVLECRVSEEQNYETLTREAMRGSDEVCIVFVTLAFSLTYTGA